MKNFFKSGLVAAGALAIGSLLVGKASATLMYYDDFNYTAGDILVNGGGNWLINGTAGTNRMSVVNTASDSGNSLSYVGLPASAGNRIGMVAASGDDVRRSFTAVTANQVYASFLVKVTQVNATAVYFAHFNEATVPGTTFHGRLFAVQGSSASFFRLGMDQSGTATINAAAEYPVGTTILVVMKYDIVAGATNDVISYFVNPTLGASEPAATFSQTGDTSDVAAGGIGAFSFRQGATAGGVIVEVDELRVGSTWADVTPSGAGAPEIAVADSAPTAIADGGSFNYGSHVQGSGDDTEVFTVSNTGTATLNISSVNITGAAFAAGGDALASTIAAGGSDTFSVVFDVDAAVSGHSGSITINSDDGDEAAYDISLSGTITAAAAPEISVSETSFGAVTDGVSDVPFTSATFAGAASTRTFTVTNSGTATLNLSGLTVGGGTFVAGSDPLVASLAPAASDTFTVDMGTGLLGLQAGSVSFTTNDGDENPFNYAVNGTVNAGPAPTVLSIVPNAAGTSVEVTFSKNMTSAGTVTPTPDSTTVLNQVVTLGYTTPLAAFPTVTALGMTGATAFDAGSVNVSANLVGQAVTTAQLRGTVDALGVSSLEGATGVDADGTWVRTGDIVLENNIDPVNDRNITIAGSPGITVRGSANGVWSSSFPGDHITVAGQVTSFNGLLEIINVSAGNVLLSTDSVGNALPAATVTTNSNGADFAFWEPLECTFVRVKDCHFVTGPGANFPTQASGSGVNYTVSTDVTNTNLLTVRIDRDISNQVTDGFDGQVAPAADFDLVGIVQQFDNASPFDSGYQIIPLGFAAGILTASGVNDWMILNNE